MTFLSNLDKILHEKMSLERFELTSLFQYAPILLSKIANFQGLKVNEILMAPQCYGISIP